MPSQPKNPAESGAKAADPRQERLAQALRDNLKKRKAQQRERQGQQEGQGEGADRPKRGEP